MAPCRRVLVLAVAMALQTAPATAQDGPGGVISPQYQANPGVVPAGAVEAADTAADVAQQVVADVAPAVDAVTQNANKGDTAPAPAPAATPPPAPPPPKPVAPAKPMTPTRP